MKYLYPIAVTCQIEVSLMLLSDEVGSRTAKVAEHIGDALEDFTNIFLLRLCSEVILHPGSILLKAWRACKYSCGVALPESFAAAIYPILGPSANLPVLHWVYVSPGLI